ncbi:MAG: hypothetical protein J0H93_08500 [Chlamydiales bacterium]|nr:hypothetical protein [Chlamydiales bacterium]
MEKNHDLMVVSCMELGVEKNQSELKKGEYEELEKILAAGSPNTISTCGDYNL